MVNDKTNSEPTHNLIMELRRGTLVLTVLSQLGKSRYGYSLKQRLADRGVEIDQGTLYPLLRRLEKQGFEREAQRPGPRCLGVYVNGLAATQEEDGQTSFRERSQRPKGDSYSDSTGRATFPGRGDSLGGTEKW